MTNWGYCFATLDANPAIEDDKAVFIKYGLIWLPSLRSGERELGSVGLVKDQAKSTLLEVVEVSRRVDFHPIAPHADLIHTLNPLAGPSNMQNQ